MAKNIHWTAKSTNDLVNRLSFDFITQLAKRMESLPLNQSKLARKLRLSTGRVSQILNNPGNLTLNKMTEYARALGLKVTVVAYDDDDPANELGPITSEIFHLCWQKNGKPRDFEAFQQQVPTAATAEGVVRQTDGSSYRYSVASSGTAASNPPLTGHVANLNNIASISQPNDT